MAKVLPLGEDKYYGTEVEIKAPDGQTHIIRVWCSDHMAEPFASSREIERGWDPVDDGHDHVEDEQSLMIAHLIAFALTKFGM